MIVYLGIVLFIASAAYSIGTSSRSAEENAPGLIQEYERRIAALEEELTMVKRSLPEGQILSDLFDLLKSRLSLGVTPERLKRVLSSITNDPECAESQTKPLLLSTPTYTPQNRYASFYQGKNPLTRTRPILECPNQSLRSFQTR